MKNRKLLLIISLILAMTMAMGGTLAYLTDTDEAVNVMTLGNVDIEQIELQRKEGIKHNATLKEGDLEPFEQGQALYPAYPVNNQGTDYSAEATDLLKWGPYVHTGTAANGLWNENKLIGALDKFVFVENTGSSDAYYRTIIAFECPEGMEYSEGADKEFMMNVNGSKLFTWDKIGYVVVDDVRYLVMVAIYQDVLMPGEISHPSLLQVVMTHNATNEDMKKLGETYEIIALTQAMQVTNFEEVKPGDALDIAFGKAEEKAAEWLGGVMERKDAAESRNPQAEYKGVVYDDIYLAVAQANANGGGVVTLLGSADLNKPVELNESITINGGPYGYTLTRAEGFTGTMFTVKAGAVMTAENLVLDGKGATATGNLIVTEGNGSIVLNEGTILQNNNGAHAVSLATRGGGTLTLNGAQIINNSSDSGAIWGGGHIIVNEGSKINNNSSTGLAGAIRMVGSSNLTMNGGEISNNTAAGDGGAIWGYGASTYTFNGGEMNNNVSQGTGGAIYTGTYSAISIGGDFELCGNKAANSGAIRLTDHASLNMTGGTVSGNTQNGESNAFNTWNNTISITGGKVEDDFSYVGGLGLTIGAAEIDGVISYNLATNHNTAYLAKDFNGFSFRVNEASSYFANFNFKPAAEYTYKAGDEAKLVCLNEGYSTYWDAATGTFRLKAD